MTRTYKILGGIAAASTLALAAAVWAQPGAGMGMGGPMGSMMGGNMPMGSMMGGGMPMGAMMGNDPAANADARLGTLKSELKITAGQEAAWQAFATQAKAQAATMQAMRAAMQSDAGTAPERMEQRTQMMKLRIAGMESMSAAVKELYAVLTPEQKAIADQRFGHMGGMPIARGPRGR